jgi:hypothetical protein
MTAMVLFAAQPAHSEISAPGEEDSGSGSCGDLSDYSGHDNNNNWYYMHTSNAGVGSPWDKDGTDHNIAYSHTAEYNHYWEWYSWHTVCN